MLLFSDTELAWYDDRSTGPPPVPGRTYEAVCPSGAAGAGGAMRHPAALVLYPYLIPPSSVPHSYLIITLFYLTPPDFYLYLIICTCTQKSGEDEEGGAMTDQVVYALLSTIQKLRREKQEQLRKAGKTGRWGWQGQAGGRSALCCSSHTPALRRTARGRGSGCEPVG